MRLNFDSVRKNARPRLIRNVCMGVFLSFLCTSIAYANEGRTISRLEVNGLKRTKKIVLERSLEKYIGADAEKVDKAAISAKLMDLGLFSEVDVDIHQDATRDEVVLEITVEEKLTIIPLPLFSVSSSGISAGLFVIDANAFGLGDKAALGFLYTPNGWITSMMYGKTIHSTFSIGAAFGQFEREDIDADDETIRSGDVFIADVALEVSTPITSVFSLVGGISFQERQVSNVDEALPRTIEDARAITGKIGVQLRDTSWDGVFLSERGVESSCNYSVDVLEENFFNFEMQAKYEHSFVPGIRAVTRGGLRYAPFMTDVFEDGGATRYVSIMVSDFVCRSFVAGSLGIEGRFWQTPIGAFCGFVNYQALIAESSAFDPVFAHGPNAGIRLYLNKVSVPAFDFGVGYDFEHPEFQFKLGIGISF